MGSCFNRDYETDEFGRVERRPSGGPYRSRDGAIFGVCRGLAEYFDFPVGATRLIAIGLAVFTAFWPVVIAYFIAALIMKPEPAVPLDTDEEQEFYNSYTTSRTMALHRLKRTFDGLDRRIARMEDIVTARDYDWDQRLHRDS